MSFQKHVIHPSGFQDAYSSTVITPSAHLPGHRFDLHDGKMIYRRSGIDHGYQGPDMTAFDRDYPYQRSMQMRGPPADIQGSGLKSMFKTSKRRYKQIKDALFSLDDYSAEDIYHKLKEHDAELVKKAKEYGTARLSQGLAETLGESDNPLIHSYIVSAIERMVKEAAPKPSAPARMEGSSLKSLFKSGYSRYKDLKGSLSKLTGISSAHDVYEILYAHKDEIISKALDIGVPALSTLLATSAGNPELAPIFSLGLRYLMREVTGHALSGGSLKDLVVKDVIDHFVKIDAHSPEKHEVKKSNIQYVKDFISRHKRDIAKVIFVMGVPILLRGLKEYFKLDEDEMAIIKSVLDGITSIVGGRAEKAEPTGGAVHVEAKMKLEGEVDPENIKICEVKDSEDKRTSTSKAASRQHLVKKVMREQSLSMPEASSYIKQHGLKY